MMKTTAFFPLAAALAVLGCVHSNAKNKSADAEITLPDTSGQDELNGRIEVAAQTCESKYAKAKSIMESSVNSVDAKTNSTADAEKSPEDGFRDEINAAYRTVVMSCMTHTHCLEYNHYEEAKCYMSASDRKDAERRFSDLSERLREIERIYGKRAQGQGKKKQAIPQISIENNVSQESEQKTHMGDKIEDQDVLILCDTLDSATKNQCKNTCNGKRCE